MNFMKHALILLLALALPMFGAEVTSKGNGFYHKNELQIDLFAGSQTSSTDKLDHDNANAGFGVNFFPHLNAGVGLSASSGKIDAENVLEQIDWSLIYRVPIRRTAPYVFAGFGYTADDWNFYTHAGGGVEFRVSPKLGLFGESRWINDSDRPNFFLTRAGVRFTF